LRDYPGRMAREQGTMYGIMGRMGKIFQIRDFQRPTDSDCSDLTGSTEKKGRIDHHSYADWLGGIGCPVSASQKRGLPYQGG